MELEERQRPPLCFGFLLRPADIIRKSKHSPQLRQAAEQSALKTLLHNKDGPAGKNLTFETVPDYHFLLFSRTELNPCLLNFIDRLVFCLAAADVGLHQLAEFLVEGIQ